MKLSIDDYKKYLEDDNYFVSRHPLIYRDSLEYIGVYRPNMLISFYVFKKS